MQLLFFIFLKKYLYTKYIKNFMLFKQLIKLLLIMKLMSSIVFKLKICLEEVDISLCFIG
jgi:hypothetical protein